MHFVKKYLVYRKAQAEFSSNLQMFTGGKSRILDNFVVTFFSLK